MIKKILTIKNVGRFQDYSSSHRDTHREQLERNVLIYGENGTGKTTMSLIFSSLKEGNNFVKKRKSFGSSADCKVELLIDGNGSGPTIFNGTSWNKQYPHIEVFDAHFVSDNIFTGHEIQSEHEKNMFQLIVGEREVAIKNLIAVAKTEIDGQNREANGIKKQLEQKLSSKLAADLFIKLPCDTNIQEKLDIVDLELDRAKNRVAIGKSPLLQSLDTLSMPYDFDRGMKVLAYTIEGLSPEYLSIIESRKAKLSSIEDSEGWLETGLLSISEDKCPFCEQDVKELDIIELYRKYFDDKYKALKGAATKMLSSFNSYAAISSRYQSYILANANTLSFWKEYTKNSDLENDELNKELVQLVGNSLHSVIVELEQKVANPTEFNESIAFSAFKQGLDKVNALVDIYNAAVGSINREIKGIKDEESLSISEIQKKKDALLLTQLRGNEECSTLCEDYTTLQTTIKASNAQMRAHKKMLETYIEETFEKYSEKINFYLEKFAPYIKIKELVHRYQGTSTEPYVKYGLYVRDTIVNFQDNGDAPSMKYSLSEGDKSALAFCFFLAKLALDSSIADKVIVFDDPISSFDISRKAATIRMLIDVSKSCKQLFVLSHNIFFAYDFFEAIAQKRDLGQCLTLQIAHSGGISMFKSYELDQEATLGFLKDYNTLNNFIVGGESDQGQLRQIGKCLRTVLEGYLRLKFYRKLKRHEWLGDALEKIRSSSIATDPFFRLKSQLAELEEINDYSKGFHHASTTLSESEQISEGELQQYARRTIDVVQLI